MIASMSRCRVGGNLFIKQSDVFILEWFPACANTTQILTHMGEKLASLTQPLASEALLAL